MLKSTVTNTNKYRNSYTDFPFGDDVPTYPSAAQVAQYIDDYAEHFGVTKHCRFEVKVTRLDRSEDGTQWELRCTDRNGKATVERFDRVIVATGAFSSPLMPKVPGLQTFQGQVLHSQAFKDPAAFAGKRVVIVGFSNTGGDIATSLVGIASKIYVSHRSGVRIGKRDFVKPAENKLTRRIAAIGLAVNNAYPKFGSKLAAALFEYNMKKTFPNIQPEWKLLPAPPIGNSPPILNDKIVDCLASGTIMSVAGIVCVTPDGKGVVFADGTTLASIDVLIFCTGYSATYSMLGPSANPTAFATPEWDAAPNANGIVYPRLYRGQFSTVHPLSLAFLGPYTGHSFAAFVNGDLSAQAIVQVWQGAFRLPAQAEMEAWCDENYRHQLKRLAVYRIPKVGFVNPKDQERWLNTAAGNGVNEMLGSGREGWRFWLKNRRLAGLLMDGVDTPFVYRLFDASVSGAGRSGVGRKSWEGAELAIYRANGLKPAAKDRAAKLDVRSQIQAAA